MKTIASQRSVDKMYPEAIICNFHSKGCIQAAADILDKLDERVDPCDDFYKFACGSFIEKTVIPDDKTSVSMFSVLGDKLNLQVCLVFYHSISSYYSVSR